MGREICDPRAKPGGFLKILVTGSTGFIGSHVMERLAGSEHSLLATGRDLKRAARFPWFSKVKFISFDLNNLSGNENIYDLFERPELLIHLAWEGLPNYRSMFHLEKNYPAHCEFLKRMIEGGLPSLVITGTCLEYGMRTGCLAEDMPTAPVVPYAEAKNRLLEYMTQLQAAHSFKFKWVRLFYLYGPGQNENSILSQLDKALEQGAPSFNMSGGQQLRDYLSVEKAAEYIVSIALQDKITGVVNGCSGKPVSIKKFVEDYLSVKKKQIKLNLGHYPYLDYEPMSFWGDTRKLQEAVHG